MFDFAYPEKLASKADSVFSPIVSQETIDNQVSDAKTWGASRILRNIKKGIVMNKEKAEELAMKQLRASFKRRNHWSEHWLLIPIACGFALAAILMLLISA
jgi:hypothetical protein